MSNLDQLIHVIVFGRCTLNLANNHSMQSNNFVSWVVTIVESLYRLAARVMIAAI